MGQRFIYAVFSTVIVLFLLLSYNSCIKDKCGNVICYNGGICVEGACACKDGYEGEQCTDKWSVKFSGTWHIDEAFNNDTLHRRYDVQISGAANPDSFLVYGFADTINILCAKTANKVFSIIPDQKINDFLTIKSGNGTLNATGTVTGLYSFQQKLIINDTTSKDTLITSKFTWTR